MGDRIFVLAQKYKEDVLEYIHIMKRRQKGSVVSSKAPFGLALSESDGTGLALRVSCRDCADQEDLGL